jgi:MFS family permease
MEAALHRGETHDEANVADSDIFQKAGIELPSHLSTYSRRWASLVLVAVTGSFASGPLVSWPTLEPLLVEEGVWAGPDQQANLSSVYSIAIGASLVASLVAGTLLDAIGPRRLGVWASLATALCLLLMGIAIKEKSLNNMLWIVYPAANLLGHASRWDGYAWLWLLPEDQGTVASVVGAFECLSDSLSLVAIFLNRQYGIRLPYYFFLMAILTACVTAAAAMILVPSQEEVKRIAKTTSRMRAPSNYGSMTSPDAQQVEAEDSEASGFSNALEKSWSTIVASCTLYGKVHPGIFSLWVCYGLSEVMFFATALLHMYPLYLGLVGNAKATSLVNTFGALYAFVGAACCLLFGKLVDSIGFVESVAFVNVPTLVNCFLYWVPTVAAQIVAQVFLAFLANVWSVLIPRFCIGYGPPELFGTMAGILYLIAGIGEVALTWISSAVWQIVAPHIRLDHGEPVLEYLGIADTWCVFAIVANIILLLWWSRHPFPEAWSTTMTDVKNASADAQSV